MKKKIFSILLIVLLMLGMLIGLTACGNEDSKEEKSSPKASYTGMADPEELIESFYDEVKDSQLKKAKKYFNLEAMVACELLEDLDLDFDETYQMMFELDKGTDYIKKNYKDFVKAVEDEGVDFDSSILKRLKEMLDERNEELDEVIDDLTGFPGSDISKIELEENYTSIKADNFKIYRVTISYHDGESTDTELDIWTIKIDGKYYLVGID